MIPICLVTGFLGSGKTTFLKHLIDRHEGERIVYLVNEFSPLDIDGELLREAEDDVVTVPGGSIFCRCLVTEFVGNLQRIPERFDSEDEPLRGVVIEASGVANPMVIEEMLDETGLDETYDLATIVSIVDPGSLPKLVHTLPNIRAQIEAADVVLLNKIDLFDAEEAAEAERLVREIAPEARTVRTIRCRANVKIFEGGRIRGLEGECAKCADPNYARFAVSFEGPVDIEELEAGLQRLGEDIYRAKGVVPTHAGNRYVDLSAADLSMEARDTGEVAEGLVLIARGDAADSVEAFVERYSAEKRG